MVDTGYCVDPNRCLSVGLDDGGDEFVDIAFEGPAHANRQESLSVDIIVAVALLHCAAFAFRIGNAEGVIVSIIVECGAERRDRVAGLGGFGNGSLHRADLDETQGAAERARIMERNSIVLSFGGAVSDDP